jgi:PAS domain S-box-containing protein
MKILFVDDDLDTRIIYERLLKQHGYQVLMAASAGHALTVAREEQPDLAIVDYMLQDSSGDILVRQLLTEPRTQHVLVAMHSQRLDVVTAALEAGAIDLISKSDPPDVFLLRVSSMVRFLTLKNKQYELDTVRRTQQQLRRYEQMVAVHPDMMACIGRDGCFLAANPAYLEAFKKTSEALVGVSVESVVGASFFQQSVKPYLARCVNGETLAYQGWQNLSGLGRCFLDVHYSPVIEDNGCVSGVVVIMQNITPYRSGDHHPNRLKRQWLAKQRMEAMGCLAGGLAHEFNNMLQPIVGFSELILKSPVNNSHYKQWASIINLSGQRAASLIGHIMDFSSRGVDEHRLELNLKSLLQEVLTIMQAGVPNGIHLKAELPAEGWIKADASRVRQVIVNLCNNAVEAMNQVEGEVCVTMLERPADSRALDKDGHLMPEGRFISVQVQDSGCGMNERLQSQIFEPFFSTKEPGSATGMGLSVVQGVVYGHGGFVRVQSQVDQGSLFEVSFPLIETPIEALGSAIGSVSMLDKQRGSYQGRILLVDDESVVRMSCKAMLESAGYRVVSCASASDALDWMNLAKQSVQLAFLDYNLAGMTGMELALELKKIQADIPLVMISGYQADFLQEELNDVGILECLAKPLGGDLLTQVARKYALALIEQSE